MKVGIFTDTYFPQVSGVATSVKTLKDELEYKGHEVYIFTTTDPKASLFEEEIVRIASIPLFSFTDRRIALIGSYKAFKIARDLDLDIIHTHTEFSLGLTGKLVARSLGIPCVHTFHTMYEDYLHYIAKGRVLRPLHVKIAIRSFCNQADAIITPSEKAAQKLLDYGVSQKIEIVPTGVNVKKFSTPANRDIRGELGIPSEHPLLLSLSRIAKEKNIEALIKAMPEMLEQYKEIKLMIVGDGPSRSVLEELADSLKVKDSIYFIGEVDSSEVQAYYQAADLFVSASDSESQGLTYIEALASGTDIIAKDNPYNDALTQNGKFGATFQNDDEIAEKVCCYLSKNKNASLGTSKFEKEAELAAISSEVFGEKVVDFYQRSISSYYYEKQLVHKYLK